MSQSPLRLAFRVARPLSRHQDPRSYIRACRTISSIPAERSTKTPSTLSIGQTSTGYATRRFSTSSIHQATVVLQNPRVDEDGKEMTIEISERAAKRLKQITSAPPRKNTLTSSPSSQDSHLRVTVTSGGCHGFQYLMSLEEASKVNKEEDTVFAIDNEQVDGPGKAEVVMDHASLELLKGSTVDFTTELIGSQFKIVGNPRATSSCGCGTSFDIE
ncbi:uncharacterized protein Z518_08344 [Rhinocladiella mackenziei CBS 650.93]|uniref:Core domain-containing protein n=1 Tax=Rhinocladiella mackenziei CBS 650.93 TaxID=1442369 RepID=A0A0D2GVX2_9EURO|nr:uncharacterized protein Z518_08344 [Rhinocladiella mackenziei CBS 650.93]KIX02403.1 hypothetical protein Z518_08344 [Rhinocladiella mackenziei CBS 650.93]